MQYEYKVIPAPKKGRSARGVRGTEAKFANELTGLMNDLGSDGWEYVRSDTLPCEERSGLTAKVTTYQNILVFRRRQTAEIAGISEPKLVEDTRKTIEALPVTSSDQMGILGILRNRKHAVDGATATYTDWAAE